MNETRIPECRVPNCPKPQQALGVCIEHLSIITNQVKAGQSTWKQYEEAGICLPPPKPTNHNKCLTNGCVAKPRSRGLCDNCYAAASRIKRKKNLQWYDLEQLGLSRPARIRDYVKQSLFQEAAKLAIANKEVKDSISFGASTEPAALNQPLSVTQSEPLLPPPLIAPVHPEFDDAANVPPSVPPPPSLVVGQQEAALSAIVSNLVTKPPQPLVPATTVTPPAFPVPLSVQTPVAPLEPLEPDSRDVSAVEFDLSRINAPDPELTPEQELDAALPTNFSPPPTQFPGQEGGV